MCGLKSEYLPRSLPIPGQHDWIMQKFSSAASRCEKMDFAESFLAELWILPSYGSCRVPCRVSAESRIAQKSLLVTVRCHPDHFAIRFSTTSVSDANPAPLLAVVCEEISIKCSNSPMPR